MCNYRYLTISYLRQHKENVHNSAISDEKYECPECDLILSSSIGMRRHMKCSGHQPSNVNHVQEDFGTKQD